MLIDDEVLPFDCAEFGTMLEGLGPAFRVIPLVRNPATLGVLRALASGTDGLLIGVRSPESILDVIGKATAGRLALCPAAEKLLVDFLRGMMANTGLTRLSSREREIAFCLLEGLPDKSIAERLGVSHQTVHVQLVRLFRKLKVHSRKQAVLSAFGQWAAM